jgi:hypothetical protein
MVEVSREQWKTIRGRPKYPEKILTYDINLTGIKPRRLVTNYLSHVMAYPHYTIRACCPAFVSGEMGEQWVWSRGQ